MKGVLDLGRYIINEFGYEKRTVVDTEDLNNMDYFKNLLV